MKKFFALLLVLTMLLCFAACSEKPEAPSESEEPESSQQAPRVSTPEGAVTDETKLGEAVTYYVDGDDLFIKIKTSAEFDARSSMIAIVNPGGYLTRDSVFITECPYDENCFDYSFDKEWFDGVYVYKLDNRVITGIAAHEERAGNRTMMLYDGKSKDVIGEWLFVAEGDGKYHFEFKDSWLKGAGEDKKVKEFDSMEKEVESWFTFSGNESDSEQATVYFDGFYLLEADPKGNDKYYLMICPEGDYVSHSDADALDISYTHFGEEKCPYRFSFEQSNIPNGKYTVVLARMNGLVEVRFIAEKKGAKDWTFDFSDVNCPVLKGKYAG